jgi:fatty-acyl-CoA synthase
MASMPLKRSSTSLDIAYLLRRAARSFPDTVAVEDSRSRIMTGQLVANGERLAGAFGDLGLPVGSAVGIISENRSEYVQADVTLALGRRTRVALNARLHLEDFRAMAAHVGMKGLFYSKMYAEAAHALAEDLDLVLLPFDPDDGIPTIHERIESGSARAKTSGGDPETTAWISYTSGTTGRPKGVVLSHRAVREVAFNLRLELPPIKRGELLVQTQSVAHGAGFFILPYLISGAGVYLMPQFDPELVWALSRREDVRTLKAVPAMFPPLLEADSGRWGYESVIYGASAISEPILEQCVDRWGPTLFQDYGQSEAPVTLACLTKEDHLDPQVRTSAGRPWLNVAIEVRNEDGERVAPGEIGEVYVRGPHMMTGYYRDSETTKSVLVDGWLKTQDLGRMDDRQYLHLQGRADEVIVSGGFNIAPREIESAMETYEGVDEVVVLGVPDERWGTTALAIVRRREGANLSVEELLTFTRARLGFRSPKRIVFVKDIPRTPYGKVDRIAVRELINGADQ